MMANSQVKIIDITRDYEYERYLHRCLAGPPSRRYRKRIAYLKMAIPKGFHKKLLTYRENVVGTIEYAPSDVSYYPITGKNMVVMNCIWVLRKAKGHGFGKILVEDMMENEQDAYSFATIALENHWSPWLMKGHMEKLGFKPVESMKVRHKVKHKERTFYIHLMWKQKIPDSPQPTWIIHELLKGITSCIAHPLYHPQTFEPTQILEKCENNPCII